MFDGLVLLVDDQPLAAENSIAALKQYVPEDMILFTDDPIHAQHLIDTMLVSLVFLDIEMPDVSGFKLAEHMETMKKGIPYVFLTGHADFALESYDYEPVDFLTKPVDLLRLEKTFERVNNWKRENSDCGKVAVRTGQDYVLVDPQEILYICKEKRKVWIRMKNGQEYQVALSVEELERIFVDYGFFRCHQSFLVSLTNIQRVYASKFGQTYEAELVGGVRVPVSRSKHARLREELEGLGIPFVKGVVPKE